MANMKLELVVLPVADVDRAKAFYVDKAGFDLDLDVQVTPEQRVVQLTPPGSACSIMVGTGITDAAPGSVRNLHLVVSDIEAVHAELLARGLGVSDMYHYEAQQKVAGPDPAHRDYTSYATFSDPDGNTWVLQEAHHTATQT